LGYDELEQLRVRVEELRAERDELRGFITDLADAFEKRGLDESTPEPLREVFLEITDEIDKALFQTKPEEGEQ
jgi:DNA-binding MarR family transcriptional regulator